MMVPATEQRNQRQTHQCCFWMSWKLSWLYLGIPEHGQSQRGLDEQAQKAGGALKAFPQAQGGMMVEWWRGPCFGSKKPDEAQPISPSLSKAMLPTAQLCCPFSCPSPGSNSQASAIRAPKVFSCPSPFPSHSSHPKQEMPRPETRTHWTQKHR